MRSYGRPRFARERHSAPSNPFEASRDEVERIADLYRLTRRAPAIVWTLGEAREGQLKSLAEAPRVLHLATHGFYLDPGEGSHNPLLDSGLALSGANQGLLGKTDPRSARTGSSIAWRPWASTSKGPSWSRSPPVRRDEAASITPKGVWPGPISARRGRDLRVDDPLPRQRWAGPRFHDRVLQTLAGTAA